MALVPILSSSGNAKEVEGNQFLCSYHIQSTLYEDNTVLVPLRLSDLPDQTLRCGQSRREAKTCHQGTSILRSYCGV